MWELVYHYCVKGEKSKVTGRKLNSKKVIFLLLAFCLVIGIAYADGINDPAGATLSEISEGNFIESSSGDDVAQGGNVTEMDLTSNTSTNRWHGYVGNVTASLQLGTDNGVLHDFGSADVDSVLATTESGTAAWSTLKIFQVNNIDSSWGFTNGADQVADVFSDGTNQTVEGITEVAYHIFDDGAFNMSVLSFSGTGDQKNDIVFLASVVSVGGVGFDGGVYEYELMVPTTTQGTDTYYFYMSLNE